MPRTRVPSASPKDSIKIGRKTFRVGDPLPLAPRIERIGPWRGGEGVTFMLPDGTRHTLSVIELTPRED